MDVLDLIRDIDERARVAWLKFERDLDKDPDWLGISEENRDRWRNGYIAGYKMAMHDVVKINLGIDN